MTFRLGLTGSIGMGKSTTAKLFMEEGCVVWDADAAVHRLYGKGGLAVKPMLERFPDAVISGEVSREALKAILRQRPEVLAEIESIVHPLVARDRQDFLDNSEAVITVLDIPLLFETGAEANMDATVCVSVDADTQKQRVITRGTMTETDFETILSKQMPDAEKRRRADYVVITDTLDHARIQVWDIVRLIRQGIANA